jgi:ribosomal protein S18 acetylase RimI-like enzyme
MRPKNGTSLTTGWNLTTSTGQSGCEEATLTDSVQFVPCHGPSQSTSRSGSDASRGECGELSGSTGGRRGVRRVRLTGTERLPSDGVNWPMISVRRANYADLKGLAALHRQSWIDSHGDVFPAWYVEERPFSFFHGLWEAFLGDDQRPVLVAVSQSGLQGFVRYGRLGLTSGAQEVCLGEVHTIYVSPRTQRRGIGSTLLAAAEQALADAGWINAVLSVSAQRASAIRFYRHHGWYPQGDVYLAEFEGVRLPFLTMRKHLGLTETEYVQTQVMVSDNGKPSS